MLDMLLRLCRVAVAACGVATSAIGAVLGTLVRGGARPRADVSGADDDDEVPLPLLVLVDGPPTAAVAIAGGGGDATRRGPAVVGRDNDDCGRLLCCSLS